MALNPLMNGAANLNPIHPLTLDTFNQKYGAIDDLSRYDSLSKETRVTGRIPNILNRMQISELLAPRTAILIKNNLHDAPFIRVLISNLLTDLRQDQLISDACFTKLHEKWNAGSHESVLETVFSVLLYARVASLHRISNPDPLFQFESPLSYSNKIIKLNDHQLQNELQKLEQQNQVRTLSKLFITASVKPGITEVNRNQILSLVLALRENNLPLFKEKLIQFTEALPAEMAHIERLNWQDLNRTLKELPPELFFKETYNRLATEQYLSNTVRSITALNDTLRMTSGDTLRTSVAKCKQAYNGSIYLLRDFKNLPSCSLTRFHQLIGHMKTEWQKTNTIITRATGQLAHQFCSCQAELNPSQNGLADWPYQSTALIQLTPAQIAAIHTTPAPHIIAPPTRQANHEKNIAVIGCDWGGGHREVARGITNNLAKLGYHTTSIDLPKVLISEDSVHNFFLTRLFNQDWTVSSLFNGLLKEKAFATINLLREKSKGAPDPEQHQRKLMLTLNELLRTNPNMVVTTYSADNEVIFDACELLGIPCLHISTDIDTSVETRTAPRTSRHMKMSIAFDHPDMVQRIDSVTTPEQRVIGGPPVRHEFTIPRTRADAIRFKQEWGINTNKKVVVVSNGKNGAQSVYPELLAKRYANTNPADIPIHLIVLCGADNQKFLNKLERDVQSKTNMPMSLYTSVPGEKMEELMTMAAYGGCLVGKAGGGTLFEATTRGTRLLIDNVRSNVLSQGFVHAVITIFEALLRAFGYNDQLPWEEINTEFGIENNFADVFSSEEEFMAKLDQMLVHDAPAQMPFPIRNCEQVLSQTISTMIASAETDIEMIRTRQQLAQA